MILVPMLPRHILPSLYRVPLIPQGQVLDHTQYLLYTQIKSIPVPCSPWKAIQMERLRSIHPGLVVNPGLLHLTASDLVRSPAGGHN